MATRVSIVAACLFAGILQAAPLSEIQRIREDGRWVEYRVALDEIHEGRQVRSVPAEKDANSLVSKLRGTASGGLVLYPKNGPRDEQSRRLVTKDVALHLEPGADARAIVAAAGGVLVRPVKGLSNWWVVRAGGEAGEGLELAATLSRQPGVISAEPQLARQLSKRAVPNDMFFPQQWHLKNTGQGGGTAGIDARLEGAWNQATGKGVRLAIIDDGLESTHPDLSVHFRADLSHDFNFDDEDPNPPPFVGNVHGTSCAGVAAAAGDNGLGVAGAAYGADLVGLRLIAAPTTDLDEAEAFLYHVNDPVPANEIDIKSNSWGPFDDARRLEGPGPLSRAAIQEAVRTGRGGRGTIFLWAGGNGRGSGDNSVFDGYAGARETIAIGAFTNDDKQPFYSEEGPNLVAVAPSNGGTLGIATTDRQGNDGYNFGKQKQNLPDRDYTNNFGGTSSACPLAAGVVALMLQVRPDLGWRDVQDILIRTSRFTPGMLSDPSDFVTNATLKKFSPRFGAGLIDATAAVAAAKVQTLLPDAISFAKEDIGFTPFDSDSLPVVREFDFSDSPIKVEHAVVTADISHAARGQIQITLESPSHTTTIVAPARRRDRGEDYKEWPFMTVHFWGEDAQVAGGKWKVTVTDTAKGTAGVVNKIKLELFGAPTGGHVQVDSAAVTATSAGGDIFPRDGEHVTVDITLKNDGSQPIGNLSARLLNTGGVLNAPQPADFNGLAPGQSKTRTFEFDVTGKLGEYVVGTLQLKDDATPLGTATFSLLLGIPADHPLKSTVAPTLETPKFPKTSGNADQYPSNVTTATAPLGAVITSVKLHLEHAIFLRSSEIDMLLVGPGNKQVVPMSDAGFAADDATLVLSDAATTSLPGSTTFLLDGEYRPTNYGPLDAFPAPAPVGQKASTFSVFNGLNPNAQWQLFIRDDGGPGRGALGAWYVEVDYVY